MAKRKYRSQVALIAQGVHCAATQARSLAANAVRLQMDGEHALALSIAVLALEEIGKAFLVDGLLFSKGKDGKSSAFDKGHRNHADKLRAVTLFPPFIHFLAQIHPRWTSDYDAFSESLKDALSDFHQAFAQLTSVPGVGITLEGLDTFKQEGFYSSLRDGSRFALPSEVLDKGIAYKVIELLSPCTVALDIIFENGTAFYENYGKDVRGKLSEEEHRLLEDNADASLVFLCQHDEEEPDETEPNRTH